MWLSCEGGNHISLQLITHRSASEFAQICVSQLAGGFLDHQRNAASDRKCQSSGLAQKLAAVRVIDKPRLGERTDEKLQQLGIDGDCFFGAIVVDVFNHRPCPFYWSVVPLLPFEARSISASATRTSARDRRSLASSSACFSSGP